MSSSCNHDSFTPALLEVPILAVLVIAAPAWNASPNGTFPRMPFLVPKGRDGPFYFSTPTVSPTFLIRHGHWLPPSKAVIFSAGLSSSAPGPHSTRLRPTPPHPTGRKEHLSEGVGPHSTRTPAHTSMTHPSGIAAPTIPQPERLRLCTHITLNQTQVLSPSISLSIQQLPPLKKKKVPLNYKPHYKKPFSHNFCK